MKAHFSRPMSVVSLAAALALGTAAASAQTAAPPHMQGGGMPMGGMGHGEHGGMAGHGAMMGADMQQMKSMMREMMETMAAQVDGKVAALKSDLEITDAQLPLWKAFADALLSAGKSMDGMRHHMTQPSGSASPKGGSSAYPDAGAIKKTGPAVADASGSLPARLEAHAKMMTEHLAALQAIKTALDPLYASFSEQQKKVADGLMVGPMGVM